MSHSANPSANSSVHPGSAYQLRCAPIPLVRIGLIGLGQRGLQTLRRYGDVEGAQICALASLTAEEVERGNALLAESGRPRVRTFVGEEAWREMCALHDLDVIYICTDWKSHARMAVEAMRCGKHAAVEVPAATTVDECRTLVRTAETTQRHCFMTENCCYDWFALATLHLRDMGFFGTITHCEGAYLHDWRELFSEGHESARAWYRQSCRHGGNPYPTHGIGPIAQLLRFHRGREMGTKAGDDAKAGDRMHHLVSMTGQADGPDSLLGHANHTLITTERGVTILLQFDGTTPRPYSRIQSVSGTAGFVQKYPLPTVHSGTLALMGEAAEDHLLRSMTDHAARLWLEGKEKGVPNAMNYAMDQRFIHCLRHGLPLDIDVYDAAEWSCLSELSRRSALEGGARIDIPDFLHREE